MIRRLFATALLFWGGVVLSHASKTSLRHAILQKVRGESEIDGDPYLPGDWSNIANPSEEDLEKLKESLSIIEEKIGRGNKEIMDEITKTRTCLSDKTQCSADVMGALASTIPGLVEAIKSEDSFQMVVQGGQTIAAVVSAVPGGQVWGAGIGLAFSLVSSFFGPSNSGPPPLTAGDVRSIVEQVVELQSDNDFFRKDHQRFLELREEVIFAIKEWENELNSTKGDKEKLNHVAKEILDGKLNGKVDEVGKNLFDLSIAVSEMATSVQQLLDDLRKDEKGNIDKLLEHMCTKVDNPVLKSPCLGRILSHSQSSYSCDNWPCEHKDKVYWTSRDDEYWLPDRVDRSGFKGFCVKNNRAWSDCPFFTPGCYPKWEDHIDTVKECEAKVDRAERCENIFKTGPYGTHMLFRQAMLDFKGLFLRFTLVYSQIGSSVYSDKYREKLRLLSNTQQIFARWSQWSPTKACDDIGMALYAGVHFPQSNSDGYNEYCNNRRGEWRSTPLMCLVKQVEDVPDLYDYHFAQYLDAVPQCEGC